MEVHSISIGIVGDNGVGKTLLGSLFSRTCTDTSKYEYVPTVLEKHEANVECDGLIFHATFWDSSGSDLIYVIDCLTLIRKSIFVSKGADEYDVLRPQSYQGLHGFLVCFSLTSPLTLERVRTKWAPEITRQNPDATMILLGLKQDLRDEWESVDYVTYVSLSVLYFTWSFVLVTLFVRRED